MVLRQRLSWVGQGEGLGLLWALRLRRTQFLASLKRIGKRKEVIDMENGLMNPTDLSEMLGVSKWTIYSWVYEKRIPYMKAGRLLRFSKHQIEGWLKDHSVKAY